MDNHEEVYEKKFTDKLKENVQDFFYHLPCKFGLHEARETQGIYKTGKCKRCRIEDMFF